jgi:hypothetical protein
MIKKTLTRAVLASLFFVFSPLYPQANEPLTYFPIVKKGDLLPWEEVNKLLPKGTSFKVIDMETGFYFEVQRRAGNKHADVQPLTRDDTAVLKHLYNGRWSWKRRAILIPLKGRMVAASMHGMPHGRGVLPNGFPGHFCIHFSGSSTHGSKNIDLSHQLMILKAGGKLEKYATGATANQAISMFLTGIKQSDFKLAAPVLSPALLKDKDIKKYFREVSSIQYEIKKKHRRYPPIVRTRIPVKIRLYDKKGEQSFTFIFILERNSVTDGWKITKLSKRT